ncbi:MAG: chloride channel protein [Bacteroidetes bacterium]|nr:chloride channel protein [Bacteroidota bacterium]
MSKFTGSEAIPVAPNLEEAVPSLVIETKAVNKRVFFLSIQAIINAIIIGFVAKLLIWLIALVTNIAFYGKFSIAESSPANNTLGWWVLIIPVIGGLIVGVMARFGSAAIRGHGIPEAMEQILVNESKIKPIITFLKPISAAISIGTGGPFGAEGPIIATGGAFGSVTGQIMHISASERKIMLAAGATAGMSAIFGTPVAAVLLAIELLLFEFSPRSIIPVALACVTGAGMHFTLFGAEPVFAMLQIAEPTDIAIATYVVLGAVIGVAASFVSKAVYLVEDLFEKLPIHWMWWPAMGAVAVGAIGHFAPRTLGVGYNNITYLLTGTVPLAFMFNLCFFKFLSWVISLGSGTSGGTLAPLLTIGGALGGLLGFITLQYFPGSNINLSTCVLVGMAAMFAGASRALLTSVIFALETTMQPHGLLPLLSACTASYFVSFFLMKGSIMTEKIQRRGVHTPDSFEPDVFRKINAGSIMNAAPDVLSHLNTIKDAREWIKQTAIEKNNATVFIITDEKGALSGIVKREELFSKQYTDNTLVVSIVIKPLTYVYTSTQLSRVIEIMGELSIDALPVIDTIQNKKVVGIITHKEIFEAYSKRKKDEEELNRPISLKREGIKIILKGRRLFD